MAEDLLCLPEWEKLSRITAISLVPKYQKNMARNDKKMDQRMKRSYVKKGGGDEYFFFQLLVHDYTV